MEPANMNIKRALTNMFNMYKALKKNVNTMREHIFKRTKCNF